MRLYEYVILLLACLLASTPHLLSAQSDPVPPPAEKVSRSQMETLTAEQTAQVKATLSKYDPNTLTAEQARAIHEAFHQAGIPGGPAENQAVQAAGFDVDKLHQLDAPSASRPQLEEPAPKPMPQFEGVPVPSNTNALTPSESAFKLRSSAFTDGGRLPVEFTGDGASITPPLEWSPAPSGTKAFAVIMHHIDPQGKTKWYWTLYNIPPDVRTLPANVHGIGTLGNNSVNDRVGYSPPHSKGPGDKAYVLTVYALSSTLDIGLPAAKVNRAVLLAAMKDKILASSELKVVYARQDLKVPGVSGPPEARPPAASPGTPPE